MADACVPAEQWIVGCSFCALPSRARRAGIGWLVRLGERSWRSRAISRLISELTFLGGHFLSATFENWEKRIPADGRLGAADRLAHSKITGIEGPDESSDEPWPRPRCPLAGPEGWGVASPVRSLAEHHAVRALRIILLASCAGQHAARQRGGVAARRAGHDSRPEVCDPEFWYESFQNWQSEFLSIGALIVLGIFLRERGSPEFKPCMLPIPGPRLEQHPIRRSPGRSSSRMKLL